MTPRCARTSRRSSGASRPTSNGARAVSSDSRRLPIYGGRDEGPRPATRQLVADALDRGVDPVAVIERVALGVDAIVDALARAPAPGEGATACARGCSSCCHQRVEMMAAEVFALARQVVLRGDEVIVARVAARAAEAKGLDGRAHHLARIRCALLADDGSCVAYGARPLACRRAHSTDAEVCRAAFDDPTRAGRVPDAPSITWNASAVVVGAYEGFAHARRPPAMYELHGALALALAAGAEARWLGGEDVLVGARTRSADEVARVLGLA